MATPALKKVLPGPIPRRKLKTFFWEPLPDSHIPGTVWEACQPLVEPVEQHKELIEALFQVLDHWHTDTCHMSARSMPRYCDRWSSHAAVVQAQATSAAMARPRGHAKLAVLDLRRATAIGVRMSRMRCDACGKVGDVLASTTEPRRLRLCGQHQVQHSICPQS